jgi:hypothetical protein
MSRIGGRTKGQGNVPTLLKIRENRQRLEKILLDKALAGDVHAIRACIELLDRRGELPQGGEIPQLIEVPKEESG